MNSKETKRNGLAATILAFGLILGITALIQFNKELFVSGTGNLKIFGNLGVLLGVGMLLRYKYTREILGVITLLGIIGLILLLIISTPAQLLPNVILLVGLSGLFYLLMISKSVKHYIEN